ncbi:ribosomal protein L1/ribosomal biogenesis protein [Scheffersomyces xylosifermentans]|uniref:ribosomal protein L1/ribosomal biogenesis protein n=1 Tax=Scheffersomyces xylosifermentans TaxID=1304137 RepID=UPI00315DB6E5
MSERFTLGEDSYKTAFKSLKALISQVQAENGDEAIAINLVINIRIPIVKTKDYTPRIVPITHKLDKLENKSVLLVTKDPSTPYRNALTEKDSPTEDVFNQIYTLTKLKSIAKDPRKVYKLFKEFDIVVADNRVHKFLPSILGAQFYQKNKKIPYMVQMAKPDRNAVLTKGKKSTKLKDERCEPKYVKSQMKSIVGNTSYMPSDKGNCLFIKVGFTSWEIKHILQNIDDVIQYLVEERFRPVGGVLKSVENLGTIHVKTSESISLPVFTPPEPENLDEDNDSDFDF